MYVRVGVWSQTSSSGSRSEDTWSGSMTLLERGGVLSEASCLRRVEKWPTVAEKLSRTLGLQGHAAQPRSMLRAQGYSPREGLVLHLANE